MRKYTPEQRIIIFWKKVNKDGAIPQHCPELGACWEWIATKDHGGYGRFGGQRKVSCHRYSWELSYGAIPDGLFVLHKCDNPSCVNPNHLFLGTQLQNVTDMINKGRAGVQGERHYNCKLSDLQITYIRKRYQEGIAQSELAKEMNVHKATISKIVNNQRRK